MKQLSPNQVYRNMKMDYLLNKESTYKYMYEDLLDIFKNIRTFTTTDPTYKDIILHGSNINTLFFRYDKNWNRFEMSELFYENYIDKYSLSSDKASDILILFIQNYYSYIIDNIEIKHLRLIRFGKPSLYGYTG